MKKPEYITSFRLDINIEKKFLQLCNKYGLNKSQLIRKFIEEEKISDILDRKERELITDYTTALNKIGINLNQAVKRNILLNNTETKHLLEEINKGKLLLQKIMKKIK